MIGYIDIHWYM